MTAPSSGSSDPGLPAIVSGVSGDFIGTRALPMPVRTRLVTFIAGPVGVGKSMVARALAGPGAPVLTGETMLAQLDSGEPWSHSVSTAGELVLELPTKPDQPFPHIDRIKQLIQVRSEAGVSTRVAASASGSTLPDLMFAVDPRLRVTIALRFPVGHERLRHAEGICAELGIGHHHAERTVAAEPWSYERVQSLLEACRD